MKDYFRHPLKDLIVIRKIVTVHYFEFSKDFQSAVETHDFWELVYADKASIVCMSGGEEIRLEEGQILFHKPNEPHSLCANRRNAPNVFVASFECSSSAMHFFEGRKLTVDSSHRALIYSVLNEARKTFDISFSSPETTKMEIQEQPILGGTQLIKNYLEILLISLMRQANEQSAKQEVFLESAECNNRLVERVMACLRQNLHRQLSVDDICAEVGYGRTMVFRLFREHTGRSPMEYFQHLKINRAKQMLRETDLSVSDVADALGYATANYFSKAFKKQCGMTPCAYKRRVRLLK